MEIVIAIILIFGLGKLLFGKDRKVKPSHAEREKQTIFKYPKGGYGLDDDPVTDELMFLDLMDDED